MKHLILPVLSLALLAAMPVSAQTPAGGESPADTVMMLRLRDGGILWGSIVAHDEELLSFRRLDHGGTVHLRWPLLDPTEEQALRLRFGYVDAGAEEMMVDADRIVLRDGTEHVGLITERTDEVLWLKTAEGRLPIPLARIAGQATIVQVPAFDIYTRDELYLRRVFELQDRLSTDGPEAAPAQLELARYCEQIFDFGHAVQHYEDCMRLDPDHEAPSIAAIHARAVEKKALQGQVDHIHQIDLWRARRHYDRAEKLIASFPELYPDSPLMDDWNKMRERVAKHQERDLREGVVRSWHHRTRRIAENAARKMSYEEVLAYIDGAMGEEILSAVQQDMAKIAPQIDAEEVHRLWQERKGGKFRQASYGHGTWLLGESKARAQLEPDDPQATDTPRGGAGAERKKLEDKINRYLKNQQLAKQAKAGGTQAEEDPNAFWDSWPSANRVYWVLAYYVENSGDFKLEQIRFRNCRECGGTGVRKVIQTGGAIAGSTSGERLIQCPTCHTIAVVRMVRYR